MATDGISSADNEVAVDKDFNNNTKIDIQIIPNKNDAYHSCTLHLLGHFQITHAHSMTNISQ